MSFSSAPSREHVLERVRAGVLEQGTVDLLDEAGLGARLHAEGLRHDGISLAFDNRLHRIDMAALTGGKHVTIYGQTEVTRDLMEARQAAGLQTIFEAADVLPQGFDGDAPFVTYDKDGVTHRIDCDFIAGCDGYHGVSRKSVPEAAITTFERQYPFGWLGVLAEVPPADRELVYANHASGFALCSMRSTHRSRYYVQCPLDERIEAWSDQRFWDELRSALACRRRRSRHDWTVIREIDRAAALLRGRADAVRAPVPGRRCRAHRAADRRQGPQSGGERRALSLCGSARVLSRKIDGRHRRLFGARRWRGSGRRCASPGG